MSNAPQNTLPQPLPIDGIRIATAAAGLRYQNRDDLCLFEICEGSQVAAVYTQNRFCAAPVLLCQQHQAHTPDSRYLLINAGNANAGTGEAGMQAARDCAESMAQVGNVTTEQVLTFSTGVIGELLDSSKLSAELPALHAKLSKDHWSAAAKAIMTTDTQEKWVSEQATINGHTITMTGISKGSGMIEPNMATMLGYIACDAGFSDRELLQSCLKQASDISFNAITVDGDTSTNDSLVCICTGQSDVIIDSQSLEAFMALLESVCIKLAQAIIYDAEGATKFVTIEVLGADTDADAKSVAYTVARSPLVKTALFASDPNWGRILAAIGRAPIATLNIDLIDIQLGDVALIDKGQPAKSYTEAQGQAQFSQSEINIHINLNQGSGQAVIWTSDLSHDYVRINAEYRS